ncbi:hypothetical protein VKT23_017970 [Stygiomarasmius scandens]|uniref:Mediator of RNA polymerase II transcription subunit 25 n=1 Tax=Marasmiellus scandens TaxID=2682957 RepID=A0ABR1IQN9_9AGAR
MMPRADPSIIIPEQPGLALLLLVDNSQVLGSVWTDLRDYLLSLVQYIVGIHSSLRPLSRILVVESSPASNNSVTTGARHYFSLHDAIGSICFNAEPKNGFSLNIIKQALELLASTDAAGLHAIILAGSPPRDGSNNFPSSLDPFQWALLAQYLAKERIQCHLMINPYEDMGLFTTLFEENLRLQHLIEKQIWFPVDASKIKLRVSGHPDFPPQGPHNNTSGAMPELNSFAASLAAPHPTPNEQIPSPTLETQEPAPSLVAQLQQVHGLTKKKVYGAKPVRKPFVSTEVYREGGRKSVTLPPPSPPDTSHGGRVPSSALAGRSTRLYQAAPMIPSPSRSPVDNVGPSLPSRSPVSGSLYAQPTSPNSPLTVNNPHFSPPNQWPQVTRHPTAWNPQTSLKDDSTLANYQPISEDKPRQIQNIASGNGSASALSMPPSFVTSASQFYPGSESSNYRHVPSHSTPTPPSSTSTSPSPNHLSRHHPQSVPVNGMITHATSIARPHHIPHHIPRSVYRDELLSHLEVPSKPSLSAVPGFGPGTTGSSSASPMRTPPSALFSASVDGTSFADYPFPTSTYTTPSHTGVSSPPHDFSQTNDTLPNATATLESSSPPHWNTTVAATIRQMSTSIAPSSSGLSHVNEEGESHFHDRNVMQLHSSSHVPTNIVLTPLTIPHYSLSPEVSSGGLSSSGTSSSLNGWAG